LLFLGKLHLKSKERIELLKKLAIALIALLVFAAVNATVMASISEAEAQVPTLEISKAYGLDQTGTTFFVNVTISDVTDLGGWMISLKWDPNVTVVSIGDENGLGKTGLSGLIYYDVYEGDFMQNANSTDFHVNAIDNADGTITSLACFFKEPCGSVSGSGVLAKINFTLTNVGTTVIDVTQSSLVRQCGGAIYHTIVDGLVTDQPLPIPEFSSFLIVPLFMIVTLLAVLIYRRKAHLSWRSLA
jgi:hypothetical protein